MSSLVDKARLLLSKDTYQYLLAISLGIIYGVILHVVRASEHVITVLTLPGPLFLRALQCAVLPMMFFNITVSVTKIFSDRKGFALGKKAIQLYFLTTLLAVINGICIANTFSGLFSPTDDDDDEEGADVELRCPEGAGKITMDEAGRLFCLPTHDVVSYNLTDEHQIFELLDEEGLLLNDALVEMTLLEQMVSTFESLFPRNAVESFAIPNIISVIVIALTLGGAIVHLNAPVAEEENNQLMLTSKDVEELPLRELESSTENPLQRKANASNESHDDAIVNPMDNAVSSSSSRTKKTQLGAQLVLRFCIEMSNLSNTIIRWIVSLAPFCMGFLIAGSLASASGSLVDLLRNVGVYVAACLLGMLIHTAVVLPALLYYFTKLNPYMHIYSCRKALLVALSTASSAATLPVTIQCCIDTKKVSSSIANVMLPMGANINMDGTALGFPCVMMFLAHADNLSSKFNALVWCNIALGSSLGSIGAAPVPSSGLVTMITVWQTAFPDYDVPSAISYVQAIDFFVDRFQTCTNVFSDIIIVTILQHMVDAEDRSNAKKETL